jgi:hypothetical protein
MPSGLLAILYKQADFPFNKKINDMVLVYQNHPLLGLNKVPPLDISASYALYIP